MLQKRLENNWTAHDIILDMKDMSARPEFYSGRGAVRGDLDSDKLERIYSRVKVEFGQDAADNYAQMVADIPILSATDFLLNFYRLDSHDWKWDKGLLGKENGLYVDGKDEREKQDSAFASVFSVLSLGSSRDDTLSIRAQFLNNHNIPEPRLFNRSNRSIRNDYF